MAASRRKLKVVPPASEPSDSQMALPTPSASHTPSVASASRFPRNAPVIGHVAGQALQQAISEVNRAWLELLRVCALLGPSEPLAAELVGVSEGVIARFDQDYVMRRLRDMSYGFPLVKPMLSDAALLEIIDGNGAGSDAVIASLTANMPLQVVERVSRPRSAA